MPLYVPGASSAGAIVTLTVEGTIPDAADKLSQEALAVAVHASVPLPLLVMAMDWSAGSAPPAVYE